MRIESSGDRVDSAALPEAMSTIIDSNVTTVISAVVLYVIGTDQIRGFAVTLILGIVMSMFTAIFCSRIIFEVGERLHWYRDLYMMQWVKQTNWDFMGKRKIALTATALLIFVGMVAAAARGVDLLDIDLAGGTAVDVLLTEPLTETELRDKLAKEKLLSVYHDVVEADKKSLPATPDNASRLINEIRAAEDRVVEARARLRRIDPGSSV